MNRSNVIDFIRGIAVIIMILANTIPYFIDLEKFIFIRFIFSLAAPIFLLITGYVTQISLSNRDLNRAKFISRICQILFFGVFIDVFFWKSIPFMTTDILYLIAFSQFLLLLFNEKINIFLILLIFSASVLMHDIFIYRFDIPDLSINSNIDFTSIINLNPIKRFLFDGWFPVFPWVAFVFLGAISFRYKAFISQNYLYFLLSGFILLIVSYFSIQNKFYPIRDNYLELWYPANGLSLLIPFSIFLISTGFINMKTFQNNIFLNFFIFLGKNSLFAYTFNALLIAIVIDFNLNNKFSNYNIVYLFSTLLTIIVVTLLMEKIRNDKLWKKTPKFIKFLLGYQ